MKAIPSILILLCHLNCNSQIYCDYKFDHIWIMGDFDSDTITNDEYGGCVIDFNTLPPSYYLHPRKYGNPFQNSSMSSKSGELIYYSNGCVVLDAKDSVMVNGDTLNPGEIYNEDCPLLGYVGFQNMFSLPDPYSDSIFYIFHIDLAYNYDPNAPFTIQPQHIYSSTINVNKNEGLGEVIEANHVILEDTSMIGDPFTAVKHANGKDWWLITPNKWTNSFNLIFLDNTGPHFVGRQYIGLVPDPFREGGQGKFSPDGSKYAWYHPRGGVFLYDFDRSTGHLSNFLQIEIPNGTSITGGCEFSPCGRFLYVNHDTSLFQLDLLAPDIKESLILIANFDYFGDPLPTAFFFMERTPDKRIIMNVLNGSQFLHVIQEPDKKGTNCRFEQHAIKLPTINNFTLPHFPNYRLGALNDPLCDSLNVIVGDPAINSSVSVFPNPTEGNVTISVPEVLKEGFMIFFDTYGRIIKKVPIEHGQNQINLYFIPGLYFYSLVYKNGIKSSGKLMVN